MKVFDILEDYINSPGRKSLPESFGMDLMFRMMLSVDSYDEKSSRFSWKKLINVLRRLNDENKIPREIFRSMLDYFFTMPPLWTAWERTIPRRHILEDYLTRSFTIVKNGIDKESPPHVYLLKPR